MTEVNQQQLGNGLWNALDARIATETEMVAALKTPKQGLLQQLFPSPGAGGDIGV